MSHRSRLDGQPIASTLDHVEAPPIEEMRHGLGAIQLRASGASSRA